MIIKDKKILILLGILLRIKNLGYKMLKLLLLMYPKIFPIIIKKYIEYCID